MTAFIASRISTRTHVNIMPQNRPCGKAATIPELNLPITPRDLFSALLAARQAGLTHLDG